MLVGWLSLTAAYNWLDNLSLKAARSPRSRLSVINTKVGYCSLIPFPAVLMATLFYSRSLSFLRKNKERKTFPFGAMVKRNFP